MGACLQAYSGPLYPWGTGLGEPKYHINLTRFNGVWGRPQVSQYIQKFLRPPD